MHVYQIGRLLVVASLTMVWVDGRDAWDSWELWGRMATLAGAAAFLWHVWASEWSLLLLVPGFFVAIWGRSRHIGRPTVSVIEVVTWLWWILAVVPSR